MPELALLQPYWLLLFPLPWIWRYRRRVTAAQWPRLFARLAIRYPPLGNSDPAGIDSQRQSQTRQAEWLTALAMSLMLVALAQPVRYPGDAETATGAVQADDLVLVVSTAVTMTLRDYVVDQQPVDRMTMTRQLLDRLVDTYSGRRIGLVILGDPPALWLPLTHDKQAVREAIARLRATVGGRLTDMGATLKLVREQFSTPRKPVVLVLSDGNLQVGTRSPQQAARELTAQGFALYFAGIGATDPAAAEVQSSDLIYAPANLSWLQALAEPDTGGFFHATDAAAFSAGQRLIEKRHHHTVAAGTDRVGLPRAWYPLPLALALLLLLMTVMQRPRLISDGNRTPP